MVNFSKVKGIKKRKLIFVSQDENIRIAKKPLK